MCYWRWRAGHQFQDAPSAPRSEISNVRTASEHHYSAGTAASEHTGIHHSIGRFSGLQLTTHLFLCTPWGLCYSLVTMVHRVQKLLRYTHIHGLYDRLSLISKQGIRAAQAKAEASQSKRRSRTGNRPISSMSLQSIDEDDGYHPMLPTPDGTPQPEDLPNIPIISDALFDNPEVFLDSSESIPGRTYTASSGNPMLTIVDKSGVFEMEVVFCICSGEDNKAEQLIKCGLFPATFKSVKTVFTFSVLDDFLRDNLECKTTAQQYYSKLQSTTSKMFPNLVPVCIFSYFTWTMS